VASMTGDVISLDAADRAVVEAGMGDLDDVLPGDRDERAHVLICDGEMRPFNGLVVSASPSSNGRVEVTAVVDAPEVYLADATETMPSPWTPPVLPPQNPARPLLLGLYAQLKAGIAQLELDAVWQPTPGAIGGYVAEVSYDDDAIPDAQKSWTPIYQGMANRFTVPVLPQALTLRVAPVGVLQGAWTKRVFTLGEVPTILIPGEYLDIDDLIEDAVGDLTGSLEWVGRGVRDAINNFERLGSLLAEQDLANFNDRQVLQRTLGKKVGDLEASFTEIIEVALGPGGAIAQSLEALYAAMGGSTSEVNVRWEAVAAPSGYSARYGLTAAVNDVSYRSSSFLVDVPPNPEDPTRVVLAADQTVVSNADGTETYALFDENGLMTRDITAALIKSADEASYWNLTTGAFRIST